MGSWTRWIKVATTSALLIAGGSAMALGKRVVLASEIEGQVVADASGAPVAGATVTRRWTWGLNDRTGTEQTTTDAEGRFRFPPVEARSLGAALLPHEPGIRTEILLDRPGAEALLLLSLQKKNYDPDGELGGRKLNVRCRTDIEPGANGLFWGTCELVE
ncbi:MAG: carboxypeptidase-like regulatory domain-containing protein [Pseudomonadota bacterium]